MEEEPEVEYPSDGDEEEGDEEEEEEEEDQRGGGGSATYRATFPLINAKWVD